MKTGSEDTDKRPGDEVYKNKLWCWARCSPVGDLFIEVTAAHTGPIVGSWRHGHGLVCVRHWNKMANTQRQDGGRVNLAVFTLFKQV